MRKVLVTVVLLLLTGSGVYAQNESSTTTIVENTDKYKVETNRFWSNWFISVGGGAQMYFGDHNKQMSFGERLSPALDVAVGKWFTPGIGVRAMYSGLSIKGATQNGAHSTGEVYDASQWLDKQKFDFMNIHGDVLFNMSNILFGYNEKRVWNVTPYVGLGWMVTWDSPRSREFNANLGVINSFRLCSALDVNLDVRATATKDRFDGETGGHKEEGLLAITLGLTYKFPLRSWGRSTTKVVMFSDEELKQMKARLRDMGMENQRLKDQIADSGNKTTEIMIEKNWVAAPHLITFPIGKSELSNEARVNLGFLAKVMKENNRKVVYTIIGYADKGTGSPKFNERLSKARAEAVYECLVKEFGVPAEILEVTHEGGVDNMFYDDPRLSRAVITEIK